MVERQDIDALLVSALYGELTPAEETRLAAHLESHPTDRVALDDLTRARAALHESRILQLQYEPPQSVSALLIQEASRRAPKRAAAQDDSEGWFARFVRSFVQHPAWAAAAMLVLVVGAAALVSRNSDEQFAKTDSVSVETTTVGGASAPALPSAGPSGGVVAFGSGSANPAATGMAGNDEYRVALADAEEGDRLADEKLRKRAADPSASESAGSRGAKLGEVEREAPPKGEPRRDTAKNQIASDDGLELRRPSPQPKDFAVDSTVAMEPPATEPAKREQQSGYVDGRANGAPGAVAPRAATVAAPPPKSAPRSEAKLDAPSETANKDAATAKAKEPPADKAVNDPMVAWAKDQHAALVSQVRASNCGRAASIALAIENRAPAYYAQNVATDRSVKECIAYINTEREKDAELRAGRERAKAAKRNTNEPSAPTRAADQPSNANKDSVK